MVALKIQNFGAMIPAVDGRLLPQNNAELSQNTWLYSGALEGLPVATEAHTLANPTALKAFRVPYQKFGKDNIPDSFWLEFTSREIDVVASPVVGDTHDRYYWAGVGTVPRYNTRARIANGDPSYLLGIPAPTTAPGVSPTGGTGPSETRAYVYTWVSTYGEEGPPSPPTSATGNADGTWNLTVTAPGAAATDRSLATVRVYRTITGSSGSTTYYYVDEFAIAGTAYADTEPTVTVTGNGVLNSLYWTEPPSDLEGIVTMPNGMLAGWRANEVWFCEPYRPHAWPAIYTIAVEGAIVGLGVIGQSLIVCTTISPYTVSGVNPASMAVSKIATVEPCLSRGSIVSTPRGVVYASQNGLVVAAPGSAQVITKNLITKNLWLDRTNYLNATTLRAALLGDAYYCWGATADGCFEETAFETTAFLQEDFTGSYSGALIDIGDARVGYTKLDQSAPVENCWQDPWTGEVLTIRDGKIYWLDLDPTRSRQPYMWKSKVFETPNQRNFGAMRIYFSTYSDSPTLNPVPNAALVQSLAADQYGLVRIYCDGVHRYTREIRTPGEIFRLPSGFKATYWQIEIEARVKVFSIELASTPTELGSV